MLAGPVELLQENGFVGWTQTLFVAPQEKFELSFGPEESVRIQREEKRESQLNTVSKWNEATTRVTLYLSSWEERMLRTALLLRLRLRSCLRRPARFHSPSAVAQPRGTRASVGEVVKGVLK